MFWEQLTIYIFSFFFSDILEIIFLKTCQIGMLVELVGVTVDGGGSNLFHGQIKLVILL